MSNEDKEPYQVEAEHQQNLLDDLSETPLPVGGSASCADQNVWKNAAKKRSMRRLALNQASFSSHGIWDQITQLGDSILALFILKFYKFRICFPFSPNFPFKVFFAPPRTYCTLGLGALKASLIDVLSTDDQIDSSLANTLRSAADKSAIFSEQNEDLPDVHHPCFHFLCVKDPLYERVRTFVKHFSQQLEKHELKPGLLLTFTSDECPEAFTHFLGVMLKRPHLQMLLEATIVDDFEVSEVSLILESDCTPRVSTSHEVFLHLLRCNAEKVKVEAWQCQAFLHNGDLLKANVDFEASPLVSFEVSATKPVATKKTDVALPFGLTLPKPRRKRKGSNAKAKTMKETKAKVRKPGLKQAQAKQNNIVNSDTSCSEPELSSSSSGDDQNHEIDPNKESEQVIPANDVVKKAEAQIPEMAQEIETMDTMRQNTADAIRANKAASASSFFAKTIGLFESGLAVTGRSVCLACKKPIAKNSVRYSWYYSKVRPHGWVHSFCLVGFCKQNNLVDQSIGQLKEIIKSADKSSSSKRAPLPGQAAVLESATKILDALKG